MGDSKTDEIKIDYNKKYFVAFIDILGFKKLVSFSNKSKKHRELLNNIINDWKMSLDNLDKKSKEKIRPSLYDKCGNLRKNKLKNFLKNEYDEKDENRNISLYIEKLIPKHIHFSDSIVIYAEIRDFQETEIFPLELIALRCIQVARTALKYGYAAKGCITYGDFCPYLYKHSDKEIRDFVGPALNEAYSTQEHLLESPCILIHKNAEPYINLSKWSKEEFPLIVEDIEHHYYANYFSDVIRHKILENQTYPSTYNLDLDDEINKGIDKGLLSSYNEKILDKWIWLQEFYENIVINKKKKYPVARFKDE